jgi:ERCC4-type nuclease
MSQDKFTVIRDTREKTAHGWSFDPDAYCEGTVIDKVDTGDYTIEGLEDFICIERKQSIDEFAHNCIEKRWQKCMQRMSECRHSFLIFEFPWADVDNYPASAKVPKRVRNKLRIPAKYIRKVIHTARQDYNIHVYACGGRLEAEKLAYRILRKAHELHLRR